MNTTLTVDDPLAEQEVTVVITLAAGGQARDERMALVSVGVTGQPPATRIGPFGQVAALINQAWMAFGVQAQATAAQGAATQGNAGQETKSADEMTDTPALSEVEVAVPGAQETTPQPHTPAPDPQPDLSFLF
jgi:hypothetical protein